MQRRYVDRGRPYDHEAWRTLQASTKSVGVFSGFDLTPSTVVGSQIIAAPGALMLPSGIVVVEDEEVTIELGTGFPPASATDYTVATQHDEADIGLISGEAMTYYVTASLLTAQPSDGTILGWIRHPGGSVPLETTFITNAPKNKPYEMAQNLIARQPFRVLAPDLIVESFPTDASAMDGFDTKVWRGFNYATTGGLGSVAVVGNLPFPVYAEPWEVNLTTILPLGCVITMNLYDTSGALVTSLGVSPHSTYTTNTLSVTPGDGTWIAGGTGRLELVCEVARGTTIQFSELEVDFWPYALPHALPQIG